MTKKLNLNNDNTFNKNSQDFNDDIDKYINQIDSIFSNDKESQSSSSGSSHSAQNSISNSNKSSVPLSDTIYTSKSPSQNSDNSDDSYMSFNKKPSSFKTKTNYINNISDKYNHIVKSVKKLDALCSKVYKKSSNLSKMIIQIKRLDHHLKLNRISFTDEKSISKAIQDIAICMMHINDHKMKVFIAKNEVSWALYKVHYYYQNHSNNNFSKTNQQKISANNSYVNQKFSNVNTAVKNATSNYSMATSAFGNIKDLQNSLRNQIVNRANSKLGLIQSATSQINLYNKDMHKNKKIINEINNLSSKDSLMSNLKSNATSNIDSITHLSEISNKIKYNVNKFNVNKFNDLDTNNINNFTTKYNNIIKSTKQIIKYEKQANKLMNSFLNVTKDIKETLNKIYEATNKGASDYVPSIVNRPLKNLRKDSRYIHYYKQGYNNAEKGFFKYINELIFHEDTNINNANKTVKTGYQDAKCFINGIDNSRNGLLKNNKYLSNDFYNIGYNYYRKITNNINGFHQIKANSHNTSALNYTILLILGFLIGSNSRNN